MNFGDNLKLLRKSKNISQEALASHIGVSRQSVSKWETGEAYPEMNNILQLCKIFRCHINDLVNDNIIDIDSLDEDVKMSAVKLKQKQQKKMKGLSKAIYVLARIGRIVLGIIIPFIILLMICTPIIVDKVSNKNDEITIKGIDDKFTFIEENDKIIVKHNDDVLNDSDIISALKVKEVLDNNTKSEIVIQVEIGFVVLLANLVLIIIILKNLEQLFKNINEGDTPFTLDNVKHIKKMAYFMIASIILSSIGGSTFENLLNSDTTLNIEIFDIIEILFLFSLAYIFEYGYEIQLDSKGKMYGNENE